MLAQITAKGAGLRSLHEAWVDTTTPHGRLVVTIFGGMAEFERELILARTSEGRKRAQAAGVKMGRPSKLDHFQQQEARKRLATGESPRVIARSYGVHRSTIERLAA